MGSTRSSNSQVFGSGFGLMTSSFNNFNQQNQSHELLVGNMDPVQVDRAMGKKTGAEGESGLTRDFLGVKFAAMSSGMDMARYSR